MSGASQALDQQATIANNLANASTTGFRAQLSAYRSVPVEAGKSGEDTTRTYSLTTTPSSDFTPGPVERTGNPMDVAIAGSGWLAVQTVNGTEAYTRAGNLHVNTAGQLVDNGGHEVLGRTGPVAIPPGAKVDIATDGTISALLPGGDPTNIQVVDKLRLVNPPDQSLIRGDDGLFRTQNGQNATIDATVQVIPGAIEGSNVNPITAMVQMIDNARSFQMHMKMLDLASTNEQSANQLLNFSNG